MRLRFAALLAVIFILIVLVSCKSTESAPVFSDEEIAHTMYYILQQSEDKAVTSLFQNLNAIKEPMIPEQYIVMNDIRSEIPGMERLLLSTGVQVEVCFFDFIDLGIQLAFPLKGVNIRYPENKLIFGVTFFLDL